MKKEFTIKKEDLDSNEMYVYRIFEEARLK